MRQVETCGCLGTSGVKLNKGTSQPLHYNIVETLIGEANVSFLNMLFNNQGIT